MKDSQNLVRWKSWSNEKSDVADDPLEVLDTHEGTTVSAEFSEDIK